MNNESRKYNIAFVQVTHASITTLFSINFQNEGSLTTNYSVFGDLNATFNTIDQRVLCRCVPQNSVLKHYINMLQLLSINFRGHIKANKKLSLKHIKSMVVHQECLIFPCEFEFGIIGMREHELQVNDCLDVELLSRASDKIRICG